MSNYILEVCTGTVRSAQSAWRAGAHRLELCSALAEGGITPSLGFLKSVMALPHCKKHVLIRPRGGDFLYSAGEQAVMADDIKIAADSGADGVVVGALTSEGDIDTAAMQRFMEAAGDMSVTFHRAFDVCRSPRQALEEIIGLGCQRILTSGQARHAEEGLELLRSLVKQARGRIIIMPGCGVNATNARRLLEECGTTEIHASASALTQSFMVYRSSNVSMGQNSHDYDVLETQENLVREILNAIG